MGSEQVQGGCATPAHIIPTRARILTIDHYFASLLLGHAALKAAMAEGLEVVKALKQGWDGRATFNNRTVVWLLEEQ